MKVRVAMEGQDHDATSIVVIVDLGNVHDCLKRLLPLVEARRFRVRAYADLQYNGIGVNPPHDRPSQKDSLSRDALRRLLENFEEDLSSTVL
jgi:hypothetical protein